MQFLEIIAPIHLIAYDKDFEIGLLRPAQTPLYHDCVLQILYFTVSAPLFETFGMYSHLSFPSLLLN